MTDQPSNRPILEQGALAPGTTAPCGMRTPVASALRSCRSPEVAPFRGKGVGVPTRCISTNWARSSASGGDAIGGAGEGGSDGSVRAGTAVAAQSAAVRSPGPSSRAVVLGPNERADVKRRNMTVEQVLSWWPQIRGLAASTVAPVPVSRFGSGSAAAETNPAPLAVFDGSGTVGTLALYLSQFIPAKLSPVQAGGAR